MHEPEPLPFRQETDKSYSPHNVRRIAREICLCSMDRLKISENQAARRQSCPFVRVEQLFSTHNLRRIYRVGMSMLDGALFRTIFVCPLCTVSEAIHGFAVSNGYFRNYKSLFNERHNIRRYFTHSFQSVYIRATWQISCVKKYLIRSRRHTSIHQNNNLLSEHIIYR